MSTPPPASATPVASGTAIPSCSAAELAAHMAQQELPSFGLVLQELLRVTSSRTASGHQVAETILHDPGLTARVVRAANAAYLGLSKVSTVSRAVAVLGINGIRTLAVSALVFETLGDGPARHRPRLQRALARALHIAVQARDIEYRMSHDRERAEQRATEAMLAAVGELAFWSFGGLCAERLEQALARGLPAERAEVEVLGTSLRRLGDFLLDEWGLSHFTTPSHPVELAQQIEAAVQAGWDSAAARRAVAAVAAEFDANEEDTRRCLEHNAEEGRALAVAMGTPEVAQLIPIAPPEPARPEPPEAEVAAPPEPTAIVWRDVTRVLTEMTTLASQRQDLPLVFDACLEGLHRAAGFDRAVLCLYTPQRDRLQARMAVGRSLGDWRTQWQMAAGPAVMALLQPGAIHHFDDARPPPVAVRSCSQSADGLLAALTVDGKVIGFIYADNQPSRRRLDEEMAEAFRSFALQADVVIRALPKSASG